MKHKSRKPSKSKAKYNMANIQKQTKEICGVR
jgi:hypothetical protein